MRRRGFTLTELLVVSPAEVDVGAGPPWTGQPFTVSLHNTSAAPIRVVGGTSDCGCLATSELPLTLQPGEQREIRIVFKRSGVPGLFKRGYWLYTDPDGYPCNCSTASPYCVHCRCRLYTGGPTGGYCLCN